MSASNRSIRSGRAAQARNGLGERDVQDFAEDARGKVTCFVKLLGWRNGQGRYGNCHRGREYLARRAARTRGAERGAGIRFVLAALLEQTACLGRDERHDRHLAEQQREQGGGDELH